VRISRSAKATISECLLPGSEAKFELEGPNGRVVCVAGELIGTGRAASVFEVVDPPMARSLVLKLFNVRPIDPNVGEIINLVDERGLDEIAPIGVDEDRAFPVVAAPKCLVYAEGGNEPIGIAVLRVDSDRFKPLNVVLNTGRVKRDLRYGTTIALHLADLVNQIHSRGFVIGDISGTNLMADSDGPNGVTACRSSTPGLPLRTSSLQTSTTGMPQKLRIVSSSPASSCSCSCTECIHSGACRLASTNHLSKRTCRRVDPGCSIASHSSSRGRSMPSCRWSHSRPPCDAWRGWLFGRPTDLPPRIGSPR
jgi:hypothetical protein